MLELLLTYLWQEEAEDGISNRGVELLELPFLHLVESYGAHLFYELVCTGIVDAVAPPAGQFKCLAEVFGVIVEELLLPFVEIFPCATDKGEILLQKSVVTGEGEPTFIDFTPPQRAFLLVVVVSGATESVGCVDDVDVHDQNGKSSCCEGGAVGCIGMAGSVGGAC